MEVDSIFCDVGSVMYRLLFFLSVTDGDEVRKGLKK